MQDDRVIVANASSNRESTFLDCFCLFWRRLAWRRCSSDNVVPLSMRGIIRGIHERSKANLPMTDGRLEVMASAVRLEVFSILSTSTC